MTFSFSRDDNFLRQILTTILTICLKFFLQFRKFWQFWQFLTTLDNFDSFKCFQSFWKFLWPGAWLTLKTLTNTLWPLNREWSWQYSQFLRRFMTIFDDIETIFDNWKDSPGDLTFETLITILTIENLNSVNHSYLTINCDTGQHSQFLRCLPLLLSSPCRTQLLPSSDFLS